jgi:hypothetical protein
VTRDWLRWHQDYESAGSSLARRLRVVQQHLRTALDAASGDVISMCAGDGRDLLPVLAEHPTVRALLVELHPALAQRARDTAAELGLAGVTVRTADAGTPDPYADFGPAAVLLACGVFGNITAADAERTIAALPAFLTDGGIVIWTRGRGEAGPDPSERIRELFGAYGFTELAFTRPDDARFRVGMHRLDHRRPVRLGERLFTFV